MWLVECEGVGDVQNIEVVSRVLSTKKRLVSSGAPEKRVGATGCHTVTTFDSWAFAGRDELTLLVVSDAVTGMLAKAFDFAAD